MLFNITENMRNKILYIITKSDTGGAQKYVKDLTDNINPENFEAKIIYGGQDAKWLSNKVHPWFLFFNDWLAIFELVKVYTNEQPNVVHLNSSIAGFVGSLAAFIYNLKNKLFTIGHMPLAKVIFTAHGWVFNPDNDIATPIRWFYIWLSKLAGIFQDKIICVSEYDYQLAIRYHIAPKSKLVTIHNGIDLNISFLTREKAREKIIKKLPTTNHQPPINSYWVGSMGRLVKEKDYGTFIRAAALIPGAYFFIIANHVTKDAELQNLINDLQLQKRFFLVFLEEDWAPCFKAFDIFIMSSIKEGLPYVLLGAMAAELPIV